MTSEKTSEKGKKIDLAPVWNGLGASAVVGGFLVWAVSKETGGLPNPAVSAAVLGVGMLVSLFTILRLRATLIGIATGLSIGAVSSAQVLSQNVVDPLLPIVASFGFFLTLGFILGGTVEFIFFLHHLSHGGSPSDYPPVIATPGLTRGKQSRR